MFRKVLILTAVVLVLSASNLQAAQIPVSWDGGGDGQSWADANNWAPDIVPDNGGGNTYVVVIDNNGGVDEIEVKLRQNRTIDRLKVYGPVDLEMGLQETLAEIVLAIEEDLDRTLTVIESDNGLTNYGELEIQELIISGDVNNTSGAYLEGSGLDIKDGNLINDINAIIDCTEHYLDVHNGNIYNLGNIICGHVGGIWTEFQLANAGVIENYGGLTYSEKTLTNESTGIIKGFGLVHSDELIDNQGLIQSLGGSLTLQSGTDLEGSQSNGPGIINSGTLTNRPGSSLTIDVRVADVNNQGTIEVNAGGGVTFDCNLVNEPNGIIELLGGTLAATTITQTADANFAGFGGITGSILIESGAKIELTGPTNIVGDVNIPAGATLEISDGQTLITGHTTCDGTIHLIGGTVIFQGGCDCNDCNIINEAGLDRNHFDINADGTVNLKDFASFANTWLWQATWY